MTGNMIVVQWADLTGTGFSQQRRDSEAPAEYWTAAEGLLNTDLAQPPAGILDTGRHPIWTLRRVQVGRHRTWCFAVQGRRGDGGGFGVAGTCRFAFAREDLEAGEAWARGIEATGVRPAGRHMSDAEFAGAVRGVLRGLVAAQDRIPVGRGPADTADVIACVLGVLPEREARNWSWSTCALLPPGRTKRREVSGVWPEQFRTWEPRLAGAVAASFEEAVVTTQDIHKLLDQPKVEGFEEFAGQAVRGQVDAELRRTSRSLLEMISRIQRSARRSLGIDDVADMLASPMGAEELHTHHPKLLSQWARARPAEAADLVRQVTHPGAVTKILSVLLGAQRTDARNLLGLPTHRSPGPDPWHRRLAEWLVGHRGTDELGKAAGDWMTGVWADPRDAAAGQDFLRALGLDEHGHPHLYRARPAGAEDLDADLLEVYRQVQDPAAHPLHIPASPAIGRATPRTEWSPPQLPPRVREEPRPEPLPDRDGPEPSGGGWLGRFGENRSDSLKWVAGGMLAATVLAAPVIVVVLLRPDTRDLPAMSSSPVHQQPASEPPPPARGGLRTVNLKPPVVGPQADIDAKELTPYLADRTVTAALLLTDRHQGTEERARNLQAALLQDPSLRHLHLRTLPAVDPDNRPQPGMMQVIIVYTG